MNISAIAQATGGVVIALQGTRQLPKLPAVISKATAREVLQALGLKPGAAKLSTTGVVERYRGDVDLGDYGFTKLPLQFEIVDGDFSVIGNELQDLHGCPNHVGKSFIAARNRLRTLAGGPVFVGKNFDVSENQLRDLDHGPVKVLGNYIASRNPVGFDKPKGILGIFFGGR